MPQAPVHPKIFRDFGGINTQAHRQAIKPNEFAWIENLMPLGHGNLLVVPAPSPPLLGFALDGTIYCIQNFNRNGVDYLFLATTNGHCYEVPIGTWIPREIGPIVPNVPSFGPFGIFIAQWKNERILIADPIRGFFDWDGTTLTPPGRVLSLTITNGGAYTAIPTISFVGGGGSGAAANAVMGISGAQVVTAGGAGYTVGDILPLVGGTFTDQAKVRVTTVAGGVVTAVAVFNPGAYSALGAAPLATTGGTGTGCTITPNYAVLSATITSGGTTPYTSSPTVSFSAGTAAATAILMSAPANPSHVATYAGRAWVTQNRTLFWTAPGTYNDFVGPGSGVKIITDETLHSDITSLISANNFLYYTGVDSVDVIGDVTIDSLGNTIFSTTNLTDSVGTSYNQSPTPYYRSLTLANPSGFYAITGSTPIKISDALDGLFQKVNPTGQICGARVMLFNVLCLVFSVDYVVGDPASIGSHRTLLLLYFNKKWFVASQGDHILAIGTGLSGGLQTLYATDGSNLFQMFARPDLPVLWMLESAFWDMDDLVRGKQAMAFGFEVDTTANPGTVHFAIDTLDPDAPYRSSEGYDVPLSNTVEWINNAGVITQWINSFGATPILWTASGYIMDMQDGSEFGKYLGVTMSSSDVRGSLSSVMLGFIFRESW